MPIPRTRIHEELPGFAKLLERQRIVRNVQNDMAKNAIRHKEMLDQGVPVERVQAFVTDCAANYSYWLDRAETAGMDADIQGAMAAVGWTEEDFAGVIAAILPEAQKLAASKKASKADIEAACDAVVAQVDRPVIATATLFEAPR